jgi:hypothetical protein
MPCIVSHIARLKALIPPNKSNYWHVYEKALCRFLGLKTKDGSPCHNQLSEILLLSPESRHNDDRPRDNNDDVTSTFASKEDDVSMRKSYLEAVLQ